MGYLFNLRIVIYLLLASFAGCGDSQGDDTSLRVFSGLWAVEVATLDGTVENDWVETTYEINPIGKDILSFNCKKQPSSRLLIRPSESMLTLIKLDEFERFLFSRSDSVDVQLQMDGENIFIYMHPKRSLSYEWECPMDESQLICEEEGIWNFKLIRQ